jgi:hypothetical protein
MGNHPNRTRARLARYGAKLRTIDGVTVVEMVDPNDNARRRFQYRRSEAGLQRRILRADGAPLVDGSPWEEFAAHELAALYATRGQYHPILDPLGL